jgi:uncharacterized membrane protein
MASRTPRWIRIALAVSVGLNLVVAGVIAGRVLRGPDIRADTFPVFGLRHVMRHLPEAEQAPLRAAALALREEIGPIRDELRADRARMVALVRAEPFDAAALRALLDTQQERLNRAAGISAERIVAVLATLPPESRARFAEAIEQPRTPRERRGDDRPERAED